MKEKALSELKVSTTTAQFVAALDQMEKTKDQFFVALQDLYGEDHGEEVFLKNTEVFDAAQAKINEYLSVSIVAHLTNRDAAGAI